MHLQDLKYFRNPLYSYGNWVSSDETSKCTAFTSNPGSFSWGNTYERYIAREAWNAYKVNGGDPGIVNNYAHYAECDIKGQLAKYDRGNGNSLIEYNNGALTGNDADAVALQYYTSAIAENIRTAILTQLWDDTPADFVPTLTPATRVPGQAGFGNAIGLNGSHPNQNVTLPTGIVNGLADFTVATWVNLVATTQWSRVLDFGSGANTNMFLTVNAGTGPRFEALLGAVVTQQELLFDRATAEPRAERMAFTRDLTPFEDPAGAIIGHSTVEARGFHGSLEDTHVGQ